MTPPKECPFDECGAPLLPSYTDTAGMVYAKETDGIEVGVTVFRCSLHGHRVYVPGAARVAQKRRKEA